MKTATILIGNSDNKLSQLEWSKFWSGINDLLGHYEKERYFAGTSDGWQPWQNACWVVAIDEKDLDELAKSITMIRTLFKQDSVAVTVSDTTFV